MIRCSREPEAKAGCYQARLVSALLVARLAAKRKRLIGKPKLI
jgi:hypothetical protein